MSTRTACRSVARLVVVALLTMLTARVAVAQTLVTTRPLLGTTTIDFSSLQSDNFYMFANLPGVTLEPVSDVSFYAIGTYGLSDNGQWSASGPTARGVGTGNGFASFLRFTFDTPVSVAGGFVNYCMFGGVTCNGFSATMRAFDVDFNVIGAYDVDIDAPIFTTADNDGAFRGIAVNSASIKYLDWGGSYATMGDLTFGSTVTTTPEPASLALLGSGLLAIGGVARVRRRNSRT
ncbi:MAG: PEP-CTERM sorting domain-containing protein [bacterium]